MPFVQGQLTGKAVRAVVETECGHCGRTMRIETDGHLLARPLDGSGAPLVFAPLVDLRKLRGPSIIDGF